MASSPSSSTPAKPKEVKVFSTGIDTDTIISTVLVQPSLYMGFANMALMVISQKFPDEFLPPSLVSKKYNGIRMVRLTAVPFCAAAVMYLGVASQCSSTRPLGGHLAGFTLSMTLAGGFCMARNVSWYYPLLGFMYATFGSFHHYRRMKLAGSNAPIYQSGDFTAIWRHRRQRKNDEKRMREQRKALLSGK